MAMLSSPTSSRSSSAPVAGLAYQAPTVRPMSASPPGLILVQEMYRQAHHFTA